MPGFFGVIHNNPKKIEDLMQKITSRIVQPENDEYSVSMPFKQKGFALAVFGKDHNRTYLDNKNILYLFQGEMFDTSRKFSKTEIGRHISTDKVNDFALQNGAFTLLTWNKSAALLTLATDRLGLFPIYYAKFNQGFVFCTEIKGILAVPDVNKNLDLATMGAFMKCHHPISDRTCFKTIYRVPPATLIQYTDTVTKQVLWKPEYRWNKKESNNKHLNRLYQTLKCSARRRIEENTGMLLSGGIDSRMLAAVIPNHDKLILMSYGIEGAWDLKFAEAVSREMRGSFYKRVISADIMANFQLDLLKTLEAQEGMPGLIGSYLKSCFIWSDSHANYVLEGLGGELNRRAFYRRFSMKHALNKNFRRSFIRSLTDFRSYQSLLKPEALVEIKAQFLSRLTRVVDQIPAANIHDFFDLFYLTQRIPYAHGFGNNYEIKYMNARFPFYDNDYIDTLLLTPVSLRHSGAIPLSVIKHGNPKLTRIPLDHNALPVSYPANLFQAGLARMKELIIRKMGNKVHFLKGYLKSRYLIEYPDWIRSVWPHEIRQWVHESENFQEELFQRQNIINWVEGYLSGKHENLLVLNQLINLAFMTGRFSK